MPRKVLPYAAVLVLIAVGIFAFAAPKAQLTEFGQSKSAAQNLIAESFIPAALATTAADGFRYVVAYHANAGTGAIPMTSLAHAAVEKKSGIIVYASATATSQPLAMFSLGSAVLLEQNAWIPTPSGVPPVIGSGDHIVYGTPSRTRLPDVLRPPIAALLRADGVKQPKIALMVVESQMGDARGAFMMTANLPRSAFKTDAAWKAALRRIGWYIPASIDFVDPPADRKAFDDVFRVVKTL